VDAATPLKRPTGLNFLAVILENVYFEVPFGARFKIA
jgi:hypothetical protein